MAKITKATLKAWNKRVDLAVENAKSKNLPSWYIEKIQSQRYDPSTAIARELNKLRYEKRKLHGLDPERQAKKQASEKYRSIVEGLTRNYGDIISEKAFNRIRRMGAIKFAGRKIFSNRQVFSLMVGTPTINSEEEREEFLDLLSEEIGIDLETGEDYGEE